MSRLKGLHLEPVWWGLFSAGGVCFAVFIPAVVLIFGLLWPMGIIELDVARLSAMYQSIWGLLFSGAVICLPAFHAAHRIRHGMHDLKIGYGGNTTAFLCYGSAMVLSVLALLAWWLT